jgi:hypothetical protein
MTLLKKFAAAPWPIRYGTFAAWWYVCFAGLTALTGMM